MYFVFLQTIFLLISGAGRWHGVVQLLNLGESCGVYCCCDSAAATGCYSGIALAKGMQVRAAICSVYLQVEQYILPLAPLIDRHRILPRESHGFKVLYLLTGCVTAVTHVFNIFIISTFSQNTKPAMPSNVEVLEHCCLNDRSFLCRSRPQPPSSDLFLLA
jgi:hypothetical protein